MAPLRVAALKRLATFAPDFLGRTGTLCVTTTGPPCPSVASSHSRNVMGRRDGDLTIAIRTTLWRLVSGPDLMLVLIEPPPLPNFLANLGSTTV